MWIVEKPFVCALLFGLASAGCSGGAGALPELGEVTGTVTLDGEALDQARVEFTSDTARPSVGMTDSAGVYVLQFDDKHKGAAVGNHKVRISTRLNPANDKDDRVPKKYNETTELAVEVSSGSNTHDFELSSK